MDYHSNNPSDLEVTDIPKIPEELLSQIRSLARAAYMFRGVFTQAAEGKPLSEIMEERGDYLLLADIVVTAWVIERLVIKSE